MNPEQHDIPRSRASILPGTQHTEVLARARRWVLDLFHDHADPRLAWHTFSRTNDLLALLARLAREEKLPTQDQFALYLAGWFAYTGWLFDPQKPVQTARRLASQFMRAEELPDGLIETVIGLLPFTHREGSPAKDVERVLWDAVLALHYGPDYRESQARRRREAESLREGEAIPAEVWQQDELLAMRSAGYVTASGKASFEPLLLDHIRSLEQKQIRRAARVSADAPAPVNTNSAVQTYFRTSFHNHIHLSAIADRKAQMLISVNAILLSVLITVLTYSNMAETRPQLLLPVIVFMVCSLGSLVFGVLSARPRITRAPVLDLPPQQRQPMLLFFGNYTQLEVDQYIREMMDLQQDGETLYRAMHHDIYHLGAVLDRKYRLVAVAYTLFMAGFVGAVGGFLLVEWLVP